MNPHVKKLAKFLATKSTRLPRHLFLKQTPGGEGGSSGGERRGVSGGEQEGREWWSEGGVEGGG